MKQPRLFMRPHRLPARSAFFLLLLGALWGYVIPYQAGVRLDKAIATWATKHPDWQLIRQTQSPYQRDFTLVRHSPTGAPSLAFLLTLHTLPPGWPTAKGNQWGWARFKLKLAPESPVQIYPLPRVPNAPSLSLAGWVNWQGQLIFSLADTPNAGAVRVDAARNSWRGALDTAGFAVHWGQADYLFGRTVLTFNADAVSSTGAADLSQLIGAVDLDISQLGWVVAGQRGRINHVQLRLSQAPMNQGAARQIEAFCAARAVHVNQQLWGSGQLSIRIQGAEPTLFGHVATLITDLPRALLQTGFSPQPPDAQYLAHLRHALPQDTLPALLVALRAANVRLGGLRWQSPAGQFELAGQAFGPRYKTTAPTMPTLNPIEPPLTWQVHAQLQKTRTQGPPQGAPMNISYGVDGWQINGQSVDSSAIFP